MIPVIDNGHPAPIAGRPTWWDRPLVSGLALALLSGLLFFYRLDEKDLWGRPEARSAVGAREMVQTGDYLVSQLFGRPFLDNRPPGYWWLVAAAYKLTGVQSELTARVPTALAATGCVLAVFGFGCQLAGPRTGFWAGIVLLGTIKFTWQARLAEPDMLLTLWTCLGYWAFWQSLVRPERSGLWIVAFQIMTGLGALTKGPGIIVTLLLPIAIYLAWSGRWRQVNWKTYLSTSPIMLGLSFGWYLYVWWAVPTEHTQLMSRFLNQRTLHVRDILYYVYKLPLLLGPVTILLPLLWWQWRRASLEDRRGHLGYLLSWSIGIAAVFSLFPSKQTHYLVPAFPGLALALGLAIARHQRESKFLEQCFVAVIAVGILAAILGWMVLAPQNINFPNPLFERAALAACIAAVGVLIAKLSQGQARFAFRLAWGCWLIALAVVLGEIVPRLDHTQSPRSFADRVDQLLPADARLGVLSNHPAVPFYLNKPVVLLEDPAQARAFLEASPHNYLILESDELADEWKGMNLDGTAILLEQENFMKQDVTAYLLHHPKQRL